MVVSHSIPIVPHWGSMVTLRVFASNNSMYFSTQDGNQRWENPGFFNRKMMHHGVKRSWFSSGHWPPKTPGGFPKPCQVATGMNCGVSGDDKSLVMVLHWHSMINRFAWKSRFTPQISWNSTFKRGTWSIPKSLKSYLKITFMRNGSLSLVFFPSISRCFIVQYESEMLLSYRCRKLRPSQLVHNPSALQASPGLVDWWWINDFTSPKPRTRDIKIAGRCWQLWLCQFRRSWLQQVQPSSPKFRRVLWAFGPSSDAGCTLERGYEWPAEPVRRRIYWDTFSLLLWQQSTTLS